MMARGANMTIVALNIKSVGNKQTDNKPPRSGSRPTVRVVFNLDNTEAFEYIRFKPHFLSSRETNR